MQIAFEGSPYISIMMINLKKNSKEMTQLLEWSCLSGPQWLLYCVAVPASLYGPVPSWPGADDYSKVSLAKQVSLNIKFPVGHWPIWCQDPKKTTFSALRRSRREHYRQNPAHQQPIRVSGDLSGRWKYLSEISFQAICQNIATCEFFTHATDVRRLAVFLPGFHILHRSGDSENNEQLEKTLE